jgi:large subunit ribosomal protein L18
MAKGASYRVQLRRRREGKTDYQARKAMVICTRPRLVTRPTIRNVNAQIIVAKQKGDLTIVSANSHELIKKYGWKAPTGNIPAAYLTGLLCGLKAKTAGVNEAILDLGLINPTKGARVFAVLHGVIDAGVEIPHGQEKIAKDRSKGDHIARYARNLSDEQQVYQAKFSKYTAGGVTPEKVAEHFSQVRAAIVASFKGLEVAPEPESAPEPKSKAAKPATKPEAKSALTPKAEVKVPVVKPKEVAAPKAEVPEEPKAVAKVQTMPAPKPEGKPASKMEIKSEPKVKAVEKQAARAAKENAPAEKESPKAKPSNAKAKAAPKKKVAKEQEEPTKKVTKAKEPKAEKGAKEKPQAKTKTAKGKATTKKATKKGEKKE